MIASQSHYVKLRLEFSFHFVNTNDFCLREKMIARQSSRNFYCFSRPIFTLMTFNFQGTHKAIALSAGAVKEI